MDKKTKQTLLIVGIIEAVVLIFCLIVAIITLATMPSNADIAVKGNCEAINGPFIGYLQDHSVLFFCTICLPCFIILVVDGVYLIIYATKKQSNVTDTERAAIEEEAKRQAREEVMKELAKEKEEKKD